MFSRPRSGSLDDRHSRSRVQPKPSQVAFPTFPSHEEAGLAARPGPPRRSKRSGTWSVLVRAWGSFRGSGCEAGHERRRPHTPLGHCPAGDVGAAGAQREGRRCPAVSCRVHAASGQFPRSGADEAGKHLHAGRAPGSQCVHARPATNTARSRNLWRGLHSVLKQTTSGLKSP